MAAPGETDLGQLLSALTVSRRSGTYTMVERDHDASFAGSRVEAVVREASSTTFVVDVTTARAAGDEVPVELAWLTLDVESSLEAVGLTAHVARVLADAAIPCNVLAGLRHDHLLVPVGRAADAMELLSAARPAPPPDTTVS